MRRGLVFSLMLLWGAATAHAQIRIRVTVRNPAPSQLSAWQTDPGVVRIEITNQGAELPAVRLSGEIRAESGRIVASTNDADPSIPRFTLLGNGRSTRLFGRDVLSTSAVRIDRSVSNMAAKTNSLPEGDYVFCVRLLTDAGEEVSEAEEACGEVQIIIANPPQLVLPAEGQMVNNRNVQFQWTPVQRSIVSGNVEYDLVVVPITGSEQPAVAIKRNEKLLNRRERRYGYMMSSADRPLTANGARRFAWQVRAVTSDGLPCTSNEGYSEVGTFEIADQGEDVDASIDRAKPDTVLIRGHRIAVTKWGTRNDDGSYSAQGCMVIKCDMRTNASSKTSAYGKSTYRLPGYSMRQFTVRDNVTDTSTEVSVEQVRRSGASFNPGDAITLPVRPTRESTSRFTSRDVANALQSLSGQGKDCFEVQLTRVRWQGAVKKTMQCAGNVVYARTEESVSIPVLYPADSFVVEVDSVVIPDAGEVVLVGKVYHTSALIGDGTGELARIPVRWTTQADGDICLRRAQMTGKSPVMWIGETGIAFTTSRYLVNFQDARDPFIYFDRAQTIDPPDTTAIYSNTAYLMQKMSLSDARLKKNGFTGLITNFNARLVPQRTSTPRAHLLDYSSISLVVEDNRFKYGRISATIDASRRHSNGMPWMNSIEKSIIDSNYTMFLEAADDATRPRVSFGTRNTGAGSSFLFVGLSNSESMVYARYPATATYPPEQFNSFVVENPKVFMEYSDLSGILLTHHAKPGIVIDSCRDLAWQEFAYARHIDGFVLLGPGGVTGKLRYDGHNQSGATVTSCDIYAGRLGSTPQGKGRFASRLKDEVQGGKSGGPDFYFEFMHDVADTNHLAARLRLPAPLKMQFDVIDMTVSSMGDVPAAQFTIDSADRKVNPWAVEFLPQQASQKSMGYVAFDRGVVNMTQSAFAEHVHFEKPFNVHLIEFNADGNVGEIKLDANSAGQKFDGLNYAPESVRLSAIPPPTDSMEYLGTTGHVSVPFFGAKYMHIVDSRDADTVRPKRSRNVSVPRVTKDGYNASDLNFARSDEQGRYEFDGLYNADGQDGFIGTGIIQPSGLSPMRGQLTVNRISTCFKGNDLEFSIADYLVNKSMFGMIDSAWICGCVENDALATYAFGGRGQFNEGFPFVAGLDVGTEITFGVRDDVATVWSSGAVQANFKAYHAFDAMILFRGVVDKRAKSIRGTMNFDVTKANALEGTTFTAEVDVFNGYDRSTGSFMFYLQGKAKMTADAHVGIMGSRQAVEGGLFMGGLVPRDRAWVLYATDSRFRLRDDFLSNTVSGFYVYALASGYRDYLLFAGRVDAFAGVGIINLNVATSVGVDLHGSVFGGLLYGSALLNLQLALGADIGFYGRGTFQGCFDTIFWDKYCTDVGIGMGLTRARGFYIE